MLRLLFTHASNALFHPTAPHGVCWVWIHATHALPPGCEGLAPEHPEGGHKTPAQTHSGADCRGCSNLSCHHDSESCSALSEAFRNT